jgi:hypothetical protein
METIIIYILWMSVITVFFLSCYWIGRFFERRALQRKLTHFAQLKCPFCDMHFGAEVVMRAKEEDTMSKRKAIAENPGLELRFFDSVPVKCPQCERTSYYNNNQMYAARELAG